MNGSVYQPKVMLSGPYTIEVGEGATIKRFFEVEATKSNSKKITIEVN